MGRGRTAFGGHRVAPPIGFRWVASANARARCIRAELKGKSGQMDFSTGVAKTASDKCAIKGK